MTLRQQTTHRISRGYDSELLCYVRDEDGPVDLTARALTASVRAYGRNGVLTSMIATQASAGKVTFTVPADVIEKQLCGSLYRFDVEADGQPAYQALIEIA